jgi:hypothetical protein
MIEKTNEVIHTDKDVEIVMVPFFSVELKKVLLMRLDDFQKKQDVAPQKF